MAKVCVLIVLGLAVPLAYIGHHLRNVMIQTNCGHCDFGESEDDATAWRGYADRINAWKEGRLPGWDEAVSGTASKPEHVGPFIEWLGNYIKEQNVTSVVDVSCGHWPSGWQQSVNWHGVDYLGIDILPENIEENARFLKYKPASAFGLSNARFEVGDMKKPLPNADLLITKDTLIHIPNWGVLEFMDANVKSCPAKFTDILFVHDHPPPWKFRWGGVPVIRHLVHNWDIKKFGGFHEIDVRVSPFHLDAENLFVFMTSSRADRAEVNPKVVQRYVPQC